MGNFIKQISIGFVILAVILSVMLYVKGYNTQEIFQNVVALTVSAIPEGLTIAMTVVLSIASSKMAKKNVIMKKLSSVESLGSCTVIATDKTGTLTANEQTAKRIVLPTRTTAYIKGVGYNDVGEVEFDENIMPEERENLKEIAKLGMLNNEASLKLKDGKWTYHGDAIDIAFLALGYKMQVQLTEKIVNMIPYESKLKYSAVYYQNNENETFCTVKGATEKVLEFCEFMQVNGEQCKIDKQLILNQADELAKQGFRVIAIAKGNIESTEVLKNSKKEKDYFAESDKGELISFGKSLNYLGLVAFIDPVRPDVIDAVHTCNLAGIKVVMITGDHPLTANAIGERIGVNEIYSRVSPLEKLEIVENLKKNGEFVAVTGDGVNDSPAMKAANIGIAMGSGTDIAKETGNMIIVDDNFSSIVKGVEEGRKAYNNIRKVIYLLLSTGLSEVILYTLSIICGLPIPLTAIQLLWLNLISNGIQGDALAFEKDMEDVMRKKVKSTEEAIVNKLLVSEILISAFVMAIIEFVFYSYLIKVQNLDITMTRTYMLILMVLMENVSCFKISVENNKFLMYSIIITTIIQFVIIRVPSIAGFFNLTVVPIEYAIALLLLTVPIILVMETFKLARKKGLQI
jgi:magnesium-transporting ATPase (P-type)